MAEGWCFSDGCREPATGSAPAQRQVWHDDWDEPRMVWADTPFCAEHREEAWATAMEGRLQELVGNRQKLSRYSFDTYPADDEIGARAKAVALDWWRDLGGDCNLLIWGRLGSGKTGLAWSVARAVLEGNPYEEVRFVNFRHLLKQIRRSFSDPRVDDPSEELSTCDLLILDDLGAEQVSGWTGEVLAEIIDSRYLGELPTVTTSNYSPSELAERLGEDDPLAGLRVISRLTENAVQIHLDRGDLRRRHDQRAAAG